MESFFGLSLRSHEKEVDIAYVFPGEDFLEQQHAGPPWQGCFKTQGKFSFHRQSHLLFTAQLLNSRGRADIKATFHWGPVCILHSATCLEANDFTEVAYNQCSGDSGMG